MFPTIYTVMFLSSLAPLFSSSIYTIYTSIVIYFMLFISTSTTDI